MTAKNVAPFISFPLFSLSTSLFLRPLFLSLPPLSNYHPSLLLILVSLSLSFSLGRPFYFTILVSLSLSSSLTPSSLFPLSTSTFPFPSFPFFLHSLNMLLSLSQSYFLNITQFLSVVFISVCVLSMDCFSLKVYCLSFDIVILKKQSTHLHIQTRSLKSLTLKLDQLFKNRFSCMSSFTSNKICFTYKRSIFRTE